MHGADGVVLQIKLRYDIMVPVIGLEAVSSLHAQTKATSVRCQVNFRIN